MKSNLATLILLACSTQAFGLQERTLIKYNVKEGDTLSTVLASLSLFPLWGRNNSVDQTIKLNPKLAKNHGDVIFTGQVILLPLSYSSPDIRTSNEKTESSVEQFQKPTVMTSEHKDTKSHTFGRVVPTYEIFYTSHKISDKETKDTAEVLSQLNKAFQLVWEQNWSLKNKTFLFYRNEKHDYETISGKLAGKIYNLQGFGLGYERKFSNTFDLRLTYQMQEKLFMRALTITDLVIDRAIVPELEIRPKYMILSRGPLSLSADAGFSYLLPSKTSNYKIKHGNRISTGISVKHDFGDFSLSGRYYYSRENQDSSIMSKTTKATGISLGAAWSW